MRRLAGFNRKQIFSIYHGLAKTRNTVYNDYMSYPVVLEKNEDGCWTVSCPILPGCISEGDTKEEALRNIKDAIHLYMRAIKKELTILKHQGKQIVQVAA